jgi:hypothetical protein
MAAVVTYTYPTACIAPVVPAAAQVKGLVTLTIGASTAAETVVVTHNMNLSAAELTRRLPEVVLETLFAPDGVETILAGWIVSARAADTISLTKLATGGISSAGAAPMLRVHLMRPNTVGM